MQNPVKSAGILSELVGNVRLAWRLIRDPRLPKMTKFLIPGLAAAYLLLPIDLMPDVIPGLGQLDDLALIALAIKLFIDRSPSWLVQFHKDNLAGKPTTAQEPGTPKGYQTVDGDYRMVD